MLGQQKTGVYRQERCFEKTSYISRLHTMSIVGSRKDGSSCPDHCRVFALSDVSDADYQDPCTHTHDVACGDCESL